MFDAEDDDLELTGVCRDEGCDLDYVHPSHVYSLRESSSWRLKRDPDAHRRTCQAALREAVERVFTATDWPLAFIDVKNTVLNTYGSVSSRSIHRHIRRLIDERKFVVELDLGLSAMAYIRHDSRYRHDLANLRDHMLGKHTQFNERRPRAPRNRGLIDVEGWSSCYPQVSL